MPKVSVIIPAYNAIAYLPQAVESVLQQTFADFEVFIVDDGSSDNTVQWASQIPDSRVKLISQKNQGVSAARNTGLAHAQGDYIAFLDADDLWEPTKLEKQVRCLDNCPSVGLVDTWVILTDEEGRTTKEVKIPYVEGNVWKRIIESNIIWCGSIPLVRRCCFDVGFFEPNLRFGEDWDMWIRIASKYLFAVVQEPLVRYRQHSSNTSKSYQEILPDISRVIEKTFQSVPSELLYLKNRAYGRAHLYIAWKSLESKDLVAARHFHNLALAYYPQLLFLEGYLRLGLLIFKKSWLGTQGT